MRMKLPIELVPNSIPPRFKWRRKVGTPEGERTIECEGTLPASVENCVASLINITKDQHKDLCKLRDENRELKNELETLRTDSQQTIGNLQAELQDSKTRYVEVGSTSRKQKSN